MSDFKVKEMFIMPKVSFSFVEEIMPKHPRILEVYMYLRRYVIRDGWKDTGGIHIHRDYYKGRNLLVVYKKMSIIESELKMTKRTIIKLVDQLFKLGWIEVEKYKLPDGKVMNIYVLGKWYVDEYNRVIEKYKGDVDYE